MDDMTLRLECLRLACAAAGTPDRVISLAAEIYAFATGQSCR